MRRTPIAQAIFDSDRVEFRVDRPAPAPTPVLAPALTWSRSLAALMLSGASLSATAQTAAPAAEPPANAATLPAVTVKGAADVPADGYRATTTRSTKTLQDPHEIPQAVTTVTRALMTEQQVGTLREALRNVSGLTFNAAEGGRSGDNMMLRGFYTFGDLYLDGIRDTAQYNREIFNVEQIDVLRGAAAMLFGRGQAGGVINLVSKTPYLSDGNTVATTIGSYNYWQMLGDFNKRLGETTALRINVMNRDEGSARANPSNGDVATLHRRGLAASLGFGIDTANELILSHQALRTRDVPDYGMSFDNATRRINTNFSAKTYWGTKSTFDDSDTNISSLAHTYRFAPGTELRTQLRHADYWRAYWAKTPNATLAPTATGGTGGNQTRNSTYKTDTLQTDFNHRFLALGMRHQLLAGFEYMKEDGYRRTLNNLGTATSPLYQPYAENGAILPSTYTGNTYALYVQDSIEFVPKWKALFGIRRDQLDAKYSVLSSPQLKFGENSVRAGLSYHPSSDIHFYLSYSDSFSPTADLYQLSGGAYPAERSKVMEFGAKWLLMEGDLALRTAIYRADKDWERNTDLESTAAILTRKRRTNGIEFEAAGRMTSNWEVFGGVALMDAKILEVAQNINATTGVVTVADSRLVGQRARNAPNFTANLWSTYNLGGGWKVGGGLESKGRRYVYSPQAADASALFTPAGEFKPNTAPAYVRYDAMASYDLKQWSFRFNIQNLFDKIYYDALYDNGGFGVPGTRRKFLMTAAYRF